LWAAGNDTRTAIDTLLDYHIGQGSSAPTIAKELNQYLTPEGLVSRTSTPYGRTNGIHVSLRLARTETSRAYNAASTQAAAINPFVAAIGYRRSTNHPEQDECDARATANPDGLGAGNYKASSYPIPPTHPNCRCYTIPIVRQDADRVIADMGRWARGESVSGMDDVGAMPLDADYLVGALTGFKKGA